MDYINIKLVYSEKYNQYYEVLKVDADVGIIYIKPTSNRRDRKQIHRDKVCRLEQETDKEFVVMFNDNITAERRFTSMMESECPYKIKLSLIRDFKKNLLPQSDLAMEELKKIVEKTVNDKEQRKVQTAALKVYTSLSDKKQHQIDNTESYKGQDVPKEIMALAISKYIFVERRDDYYRESKNCDYIPSNKEQRRMKQEKLPCGFIIRDKYGDIIAGNLKGSFSMSVDDVIEFVKFYDPSIVKPKSKALYKVPMSLRKTRQLQKCKAIINKNGLKYKNHHNYFFWVYDKHNNCLLGGEHGVGFRYFKKYCERLKNKNRRKR